MADTGDLSGLYPNTGTPDRATCPALAAIRFYPPAIIAGMDNTAIELAALRASVNQLGQDIANLVVQRNVATGHAQDLAGKLAEETKRREAADTKVAELTADLKETNTQNRELGEDLDFYRSEIDNLKAQLDGCTRYMTAENALAFTTGGDPVPESQSER